MDIDPLKFEQAVLKARRLSATRRVNKPAGPVLFTQPDVPVDAITKAALEARKAIDVHRQKVRASGLRQAKRHRRLKNKYVAQSMDQWNRRLWKVGGVK